LLQVLLIYSWWNTFEERNLCAYLWYKMPP
jgi:hypothetical protein